MNQTICEAQESLARLDAGDESETPPYMSVAEWREHNALIADAAKYPAVEKIGEEHFNRIPA